MSPEEFDNMEAGTNQSRTLCAVKLGSLQVELTAEQVEGAIRALARCREVMEPQVSQQVPKDIPLFAAFETDPWRMPPQPSQDGTVGLLIRTRGVGWVALLFPEQAALTLAAQIQEAAAQRVAPPPKH